MRTRDWMAVWVASTFAIPLAMADPFRDLEPERRAALGIDRLSAAEREELGRFVEQRCEDGSATAEAARILESTGFVAARVDFIHGDREIVLVLDDGSKAQVRTRKILEGVRSGDVLLVHAGADHCSLIAGDGRLYRCQTKRAPHVEP